MWAGKVRWGQEGMEKALMRLGWELRVGELCGKRYRAQLPTFQLSLPLCSRWSSCRLRLLSERKPSKACQVMLEGSHATRRSKEWMSHPSVQLQQQQRVADVEGAV